MVLVPTLLGSSKSTRHNSQWFLRFRTLIKYNVEYALSNSRQWDAVQRKGCRIWSTVTTVSSLRTAEECLIASWPNWWRYANCKNVKLRMRLVIMDNQQIRIWDNCILGAHLHRENLLYCYGSWFFQRGSVKNTFVYLHVTCFAFVLDELSESCEYILNFLKFVVVAELCSIFHLDVRKNSLFSF
jgi:hypothetical protein